MTGVGRRGLLFRDAAGCAWWPERPERPERRSPRVAWQAGVGGRGGAHDLDEANPPAVPPRCLVRLRVSLFLGLLGIEGAANRVVHLGIRRRAAVCRRPGGLTVDLATQPEHRRGHGALYGGLNLGPIDVGRLRPLPAGLPLPRFDEGAWCRRWMCHRGHRTGGTAPHRLGAVR